MNYFINFSDSGKYADVARSLFINNNFDSLFSFWGYKMSDWILPVTPYSISVFFKIFGINDFAVIATSFFYFVLSLIFVFLLTQKIYKNKLTSTLSIIAVGSNYNLINYATSGASESPFIFELLAGTYFLSLKKWWGNTLGVIFLVLMYFTRPQAIIYIFGLVLYYFILNFSWKKATLYTFISFLFGTFIYGVFSKQGLIAVTQNLPGIAVSDSLRGSSVDFNLLILIKKVFYNLYNFYKALPDIANPYMWGLFVIGLSSWSKVKLQNSFKISVLFVTLLTFFVTALTIPFYRYIHPVVPLVYIVAIATLVDIINYFVSTWDIKSKNVAVGVVSTVLVLFFTVGQTLGILFLDSRFERKMKNTDKAPIYVEMSYKLKEITNKDMVIVTNLDTWGSWYGERKTIWFPLDPSMILPVQDNIDAIYLTSYKMDDENYYMGEAWREIFESPEKQTILPDFKFVGEYEFKSENNYERENGRAVLLMRAE
ncbi:MAG: glycosyltransferase family 39 protein [Microgenomates group bacterium]